MPAVPDPDEDAQPAAERPFSQPGAYRALVDNSMDAVLLTAQDGRIVMANRASVAMFGYEEDELCRRGREAVIDKSDPRLALALEQRRRTGRFRGELTMRRKDGSRFEVELSSAVFRDEQGAEWTSMFVRDITDRKIHERERERLLAALEAERRWLRAVLDHVPSGVILFDSNGRISANHQAEAMLGLRLSPIGGSAQYANRIFFRDGTPVPPDRLVSTRVLRDGETISGAELLLQRDDASRVPILGNAAPIRTQTDE